MFSESLVPWSSTGPVACKASGGLAFITAGGDLFRLPGNSPGEIAIVGWGLTGEMSLVRDGIVFGN